MTGEQVIFEGIKTDSHAAMAVRLRKLSIECKAKWCSDIGRKIDTILSKDTHEEQFIILSDIHGMCHELWAIAQGVGSMEEIISRMEQALIQSAVK
jgi:hypothetical protein